MCVCVCVCVCVCMCVCVCVCVCALIIILKRYIPTLPHITGRDFIQTKGFIIDIVDTHLYATIYILTWLLLGRLAFVSDWVSKSMSDSTPKGPLLRLGHLQVGELQPLSPRYSTRPCCQVQAITRHTFPDPDLGS